ncbi:hypothetical protein [Rahnella inusitata]|uniref:hypothetical protein n=1 Tax=Rahnella inusitata TaxID=58169 RepID=UPI0039BE15E2
MQENNQTLSHCPACGENLEAQLIHGDSRIFVCPTHRRFGLSGTAIAMINGNDHYREIIGRRLDRDRNIEQERVYTSDDLNAPIS